MQRKPSKTNSKFRRVGYRWVVVLVACVMPLGAKVAESPEVRTGGERLKFFDDFESGLSGWQLVGEPYVGTEASGDPAHGQVLILEPGGDVYALIRGSDQWGSFRLEGDVLFPSDENNYLGVIYNFQQRGERTDFGLIYIKGNGSYLQANPHRDFNVSRTLYPEWRASLTGQAAIETGRWQHFKVEVAGPVCHFYVGDMRTPQLTFDLFEIDSGMAGLQPRSVGGAVWVDNVRVTSIERLSYSGPPRPTPVSCAPQSVLKSWQVSGPFERSIDQIARNPAHPTHAWREFATDARGAVVTGKVVDYHGPQSFAYFRTQVVAPAGRAILHLSTVDDLALWVNGHFHWFIPRGPVAWHDFGTNPDHKGRRIPIPLVQGKNELVFRVRGGVYASGGFYARVEF